MSRYALPCFRWMLRAVIAAVLLFMSVIAVLHLWIVPRLDDWRPWLQTRLSQSLGFELRIGRISAHGQALLPVIEVDSIELLDAQQQPALHIPRAVVVLTPASLWRRGVHQLVVESPSLDIYRDAHGHVRLFPQQDNTARHSRRPDSGNAQALHWLLTQPELAIVNGHIRLQQESPDPSSTTLTLKQVNIVLRNGLRRHALHVDATPPAAIGERFSINAVFNAPVLLPGSADLRKWEGEVFADIPLLDMQQAAPWINAVSGSFQVRSGRGSARLWLDVQHARPVSLTADLALRDVDIRLEDRLQPLQLAELLGRAGLRHPADGELEFFTRDLQFLTTDHVRWPGGNVSVRLASGRLDSRHDGGQIVADRLDIASLSLLASRMPLPEALRQHLQNYAPFGLVEELSARWKGPWQTPVGFQAAVRARHLGTLAQTSGIPGMEGVSVQLEMDQDGGKGTLEISNGHLEFPGVFEEPRIPVQELSARLQWSHSADGEWALEIPAMSFSNADAEGTASARWQTGSHDAQGNARRFPGTLELQGHLHRADGTRVHRYLPLAMDEHARHYVRDAVRKGSASAVDFTINGDLLHVPFDEKQEQGQFRIAARVHDAAYTYAPASVMPPGTPPWPPLAGLSGELLFVGNSMHITVAGGHFEQAPQIMVTAVDARIADFRHSTVKVNATMRGPLDEMLRLVAGSPVNDMTGEVLAEIQADGDARYALNLELPLSHMNDSRVSGSVHMDGTARLAVNDSTPELARINGRVDFSDDGFSLHDIHAQALGGDVRLEGGLRGARTTTSRTPGLEIIASGHATAQGLQQSAQLAIPEWLFRYLRGGADWNAHIRLDRGVTGLQIDSTLQGMDILLPAPLNKTADESMPLHIRTQLLPEAKNPGASSALRQQLDVSLGERVQARYIQSAGSEATQVFAGALLLGNAAKHPLLKLPASGVSASAELDALDVDAWTGVLRNNDNASRTSGASAIAAGSDNSHFPDTAQISVQQLRFNGRDLGQLQTRIIRGNNAWNANVDARDIQGQLSYRLPAGTGSASLFARLSRLNIGEAKEAAPEDAEGNTGSATPPPSLASTDEKLMEDALQQLPALDVEVEKLTFRGKQLGKLAVRAVNHPQSADAPAEWRVESLSIDMPGATQLTARGNWAEFSASPSDSAPPPPGLRRTAVQFDAQIQDAGLALTRLGMPGTIRAASGTLSGQIAWVGSPLSIDYPSLSGHLKLDLKNGQFLKADAGVARLLGVLSLQSLPRRLTLDFRDVFSQGFSFDFIRGDAQMRGGIIETNNLLMKGMNAAIVMYGQANLVRETQSLRVIVVPEVNAGTASLAAGVINPAVGVGTFLAQLILQDPLQAAATREFQVDGAWSDPEVSRVTGAARTTTQAIREITHEPEEADPPASEVAP